MRVYIDAPIAGIMRAKLLRIKSDQFGKPVAVCKLTSRNNLIYGCGATIAYPLESVLPAAHWRVAVVKGNGKLYMLCTSTHSRNEMFAPYRESKA